jgi:hypothetical protein
MSAIPIWVTLVFVRGAAGCTKAAPKHQSVSGSDSLPAAAAARAGNPLLVAIRDTLVARHSRLNRFAVLDLSVVDPWRGKGYVAIGYGHCDTCPYQNRVPNDELFGVFAVDDSLTRIWHTFEVLETNAGRDWYLRLTSVNGSEIRVQGHSVDYGPARGLLEKIYAWPNDSYSPQP